MVGDTSFPISADAAFRGDRALPNPASLLVAAASSCQLSFLAVAASSGVTVLKYADDAVGEMPEDDLKMRVTRITVRPRMRVASGTDPGKVGS